MRINDWFHFRFVWLSSLSFFIFHNNFRSIVGNNSGTDLISFTETDINQIIRAFVWLYNLEFGIRSSEILFGGKVFTFFACSVVVGRISQRKSWKKYFSNGSHAKLTYDGYLTHLFIIVVFHFHFISLDTIYF